MDNNRTTLKTAIVNGNLVNYDMCNESREAYDDMRDRIVYLGCGKIHKIDGILQKDSEELHFWRLKSKTSATPPWN